MAQSSSAPLKLTWLSDVGSWLNEKSSANGSNSNSVLVFSGAVVVFGWALTLASVFVLNAMRFVNALVLLMGVVVGVKAGGMFDVDADIDIVVAVAVVVAPLAVFSTNDMKSWVDIMGTCVHSSVRATSLVRSALVVLSVALGSWGCLSPNSMPSTGFCSFG